MLQRTIERSISVTGIALHSGKKSKITFHTAVENSGICFYRNGVLIPAHCDYVTNTTLCTRLEHNGQSIQTIEHLMAAISALLIDNLVIEVDQTELPILDGSALPFMMLLEEARVINQSTHKKFLQLNRSVSFCLNDKRVELNPHNGMRYNIQTQFNHPLIDEYPNVSYDYIGASHFKSEVARARTFGFMSELEKLNKNNLALGGNLDNAILLTDYGIVNEEPLRYNDEFVRHKLLDSIGDLRLLGHNFIGEFVGYKPGHFMNVELCRAVLRSKCYDIVTVESELYKKYTTHSLNNITYA